MKRYIKLIIVVAVVIVFSQIGYSENLFNQKDTLTQVSTIDALLSGVYDGEMTIKELKKYGDLGLGSFNSLDGEMLAIDGRFYQVTSDGRAKQADINMKTPFAAVTFFEVDRRVNLRHGVNFNSLKEQMDNMILTPNIFYAIRIKGVFKAMKTRSVPKQSKPYEPLKEIVRNQPVFNFKNVKGTMVGFRCPPYVKGINVPGYHLHFLTEDGKAGGHVLEFMVQEAVLEVDETSRFSIILPQNKAFYDADLTSDKQGDLKKIER